MTGKSTTAKFATGKSATGKSATTFAILLPIWFALAGVAFEEVVIGISLALLISAIVSTKLIPEKVSRMTPNGLFRILAFIPKFIIYEIINHLKLIRIIYSPTLKIDPGIVEVPLKLRQKLQVTSVATTVTMLPGTLTIDHLNDTLYIHAINKGDSPAEFTHRLERELGQGFS